MNSRAWNQEDYSLLYNKGRDKFCSVSVKKPDSYKLGSLYPCSRTEEKGNEMRQHSIPVEEQSQKNHVRLPNQTSPQQNLGHTFKLAIQKGIFHAKGQGYQRAVILTKQKQVQTRLDKDTMLNEILTFETMGGRRIQICKLCCRTLDRGTFKSISMKYFY